MLSIRTVCSKIEYNFIFTPLVKKLNRKCVCSHDVRRFCRTLAAAERANIKIENDPQINSAIENKFHNIQEFITNTPDTTSNINESIQNTKRSYHTSSNINQDVPNTKRSHDISPPKAFLTGPGIEHFLANASPAPSPRLLDKISHPYVTVEDVTGQGRSVYFDVYGCQMNVSDVEVAWAILKSVGFEKTTDSAKADVILIMTCSIREGAEKKVWNRVESFRHLKSKQKNRHRDVPLKIGILGCMAERLKKGIFEKQQIVDLVMGPDSYRDLPRLLAVTGSGDRAVNVLLSQEETYADVMPVSLSDNRVSAFVSIMRGCDNMCSYCIVPFTRGKERSRPIASILNEVRMLSEQGVKEITLLGQNVNSYCDKSETNHPVTSIVPVNEKTRLSAGFNTIYKPKVGGLRFSHLLEKVSEINPELRFRFTSPHPKDFPDEVLDLISDRKNICNNIHLPAQAGSSRVLGLMRRGYTRESYLELVAHMRQIIPDISLSSDFIAGFCGETDQEFEETLSLMDQVKYNYCYVFPYSLREKTPAHRKLVDDVTEEVKKSRHIRLDKKFREHALLRNAEKIGTIQKVLVEGASRRSQEDLQGRCDYNTKVIFPDNEVPDFTAGDFTPSSLRKAAVGDYVSVRITGASSQTLRGEPMGISTLQ